MIRCIHEDASILLCSCYPIFGVIFRDYSARIVQMTRIAVIEFKTVRHRYLGEKICCFGSILIMQ